MNHESAVVAILVMALVTAVLRFLPFVIFSGKETPKLITDLGKVLPYAVMGMLVVYCLKGVSFASLSGFMPEMIASVTVVLTYLWKKNTLFSIITGTAFYMFLIQTVFLR